MRWTRGGRTGRSSSGSRRAWAGIRVGDAPGRSLGASWSAAANRTSRGAPDSIVPGGYDSGRSGRRARAESRAVLGVCVQIGRREAPPVQACPSGVTVDRACRQPAGRHSRAVMRRVSEGRCKSGVAKRPGLRVPSGCDSGLAGRRARAGNEVSLGGSSPIGRPEAPPVRWCPGGMTAPREGGGGAALPGLVGLAGSGRAGVSPWWPPGVSPW